MKDFEYINKELGTHYNSDNDISWSYLTMYKNLSEDFIEKFKDKLDWFDISEYQKLSEDFIERHKDNLFWCSILINQVLSEEFIERHIESIPFEVISSCQQLSEAFIERHANDINWVSISRHQALSESFIEKHKDKVDWKNISKHQRLSEEFIKKHKDKVNWSLVSTYQSLSEHFIKNNVKEYYWDNISKYQKLSEGFIGKMLDKQRLPSLVNNLFSYQKLSDEFIKRHNLSINKNDLWQYKDVRLKKNKIVKTGLYECYDDYFIAYKAIRSNRYSIFNFQYQYLPGETYESNCDCTDEENSFGLNVGTYSFAKNYLGNKNGIIVKCKVYYKDIGRIVYEGEKVRCFKITVLE